MSYLGKKAAYFIIISLLIVGNVAAANKYYVINQGGGGGSNPFDQSLNTTDDVLFNEVTIGNSFNHLRMNSTITDNNIIAEYFDGFSTYTGGMNIQYDSGIFYLVPYGPLSNDMGKLDNRWDNLYFDDMNMIGDFTVSSGELRNGTHSRTFSDIISGSGGNPFDQWLNTTDNPTFQNITISGWNDGNILNKHYDLNIGDDYGAIEIGEFEIFQSDLTISSLNMDGTAVFRNEHANEPPVQFLFATGNTIRMAIPKGGVDYATQMARSVMIGGNDAQSFNDNIVNCSAQGYTQIDCDTSGTGADLGVQDDLEVLGKIYSNDWSDVSITESQISDLSHTTDTSADTECSGTSTYLDGEGNCDELAVSGITTEQFEGETTRNFMKNACFYEGTDTNNGVPGWDYSNAAYYDLVDATVGTGFVMNITEDVDDSTFHHNNYPYFDIEVNTTNFSSIDEDGDLSNRWVRFEGNVNSDNTNLTYKIDSYNTTHIKLFVPDGYLIPGYTRTTYWGGDMNVSERLEVVDSASRCSKAVKVLGATNSLYSNWITVPNGVPFLIDIEFNAPIWVNRTGYDYARAYVQVEAADLDENIIYRYNTVAGPDYKSVIGNTISGIYDYYGAVGTEGWRRMQFQLPDLSNPDNWIAVATSQGIEEIAKVGSAYKIRVRLLNQYSNGDVYWTGAQLLQGTSAKAFNLAELNEDSGGYTGTCSSSSTLTVEYGLITGCS